MIRKLIYACLAYIKCVIFYYCAHVFAYQDNLVISNSKYTSTFQQMTGGVDVGAGQLKALHFGLVGG
jgi:ABC-type transporter Mla maintaining outer membrane lipid asymmetry permease subunit MlaE